MNILWVKDGKLGHEKQVDALLEEINSTQHIEITEIKASTVLNQILELITFGLFRKDKNISLGAIQAELGRWCLLEYPRVVKQRNSNANKLADFINSKTWGIDENVNNVFHHFLKNDGCFILNRKIYKHF